MNACLVRTEPLARAQYRVIPLACVHAGGRDRLGACVVSIHFIYLWERIGGYDKLRVKYIQEVVSYSHVVTMAASADHVPLPETKASSEQSWLGEGSTCFPVTLLQECFQWLSELHMALCLLDKTGAHLTQSLVKALEHTAFRCVASVLVDRLADVFTAATSQAHLAIVQELETMIAGLISTEKRQTDPQSLGQVGIVVYLCFFKVCQGVQNNWSV